MKSDNLGNNSEEDKPRLRYPPAMMLGINMATGMVFFSYIGFWCDQKWDKNIFTLIGIFLGLLYCGYEVWRLIRSSDQ